jgi:4-amino-4-deoxy-L-arabinose transferase-like glycosyltransferase
MSLELATVAGFCAFLFFFGLDAFGLTGADEPRYAQVAREMLERRDFVTPELYGVAWLEKPPLYYWGAALSFAVLGVSDFAARLPVALLATIMVFFVYFFVRRFRPGAQTEAALITASCAAVLGFARGASTDMPLAAPFACAMLSWYGWHETRQRAWLAAFYVLMGMSVLAKGPVAPGLAAMVIAAFLFLRRPQRPMLKTVRDMLWLPGLLLFLAVALPWFVAAQMANPEFFRIFFLEHNLLRFSSNLYRHAQPFWYYVLVLLLSLAPWTVLALGALVEALRNGRKGDALGLYLGLWAVIPVLFFSFSGSKLPGYILPAIPALTVLLGLYVHRRLTEGVHVLLIALHALVCGAVLSATLLAPYVVAKVVPPAAVVTMAVPLGLLVAAAIFFTVRLQGVRMLRFVTLAPVIVGVAFILQAAAPAVDQMESARPLARHLQQMGAGKDVDLAVLRVSRQLEYGLAWYRGRGISRYERGQVPAREHLLVVREGERAELLAAVADRRLSMLGSFPSRQVDLFWVTQGMDHTGHEHAPGEEHPPEHEH